MKSTILSALAAFALAVPAMSAQAPTPPRSPELSLVTVSGDAEVKTDPDVATVRVGVEAQAATAGQAQQQVNATATRIIAAAQRVVSDRKMYQTSDLSLEPVYENAQNRAPRITGYRARNVVVVRIEDLTKVGPLIDAATGAGATNVDSISFGLKNDLSVRKEALKQAVREAREKAEALAEGLGVKLGAVYEIIDGGGPRVTPYERPMMARMAMADSAPVLPGQVGVSANVTVRFRLLP